MERGDLQFSTDPELEAKVVDVGSGPSRHRGNDYQTGPGASHYMMGQSPLLNHQGGLLEAASGLSPDPFEGVAVEVEDAS